MLQGKKILLVDDDVIFCELVERMLTRQGADVMIAHNGDDGLRQFYRHQPHLLLLDLMLPGLDGWGVCQQVGQIADTPVIFISALGDEATIVRGLEMGATDYIVKPINHKELLLRIRLALSRAPAETSGETHLIYRLDHLTVNVTTRRVNAGDRLIRLTHKEFALLVYFLENRGKTMTFNQILSQVWGWEYRDHPEYVHVYINRLRQKIEPNPQEPAMLLTEYGVGYRLARQVALSLPAAS